jgi:hypothetical protein
LKNNVLKNKNINKRKKKLTDGIESLEKGEFKCYGKRSGNRDSERISPKWKASSGSSRPRQKKKSRVAQSRAVLQR